ncbi:unnamed protein product [Mortierella alpina]
MSDEKQTWLDGFNGIFVIIGMIVFSMWFTRFLVTRGGVWNPFEWGHHTYTPFLDALQQNSSSGVDTKS